MRLIDIGIGLLILLILGGTLLSVRIFADPDRKLVRNSDAEVIEAALQSLYEPHSARLVDWSSGTLIAVHSECEFSSPSSSDFNGALNFAIAKVNRNEMVRTSFPLLQGLAKRYAGMSCPLPNSHLNLKSLRMDARIVITDRNNGGLIRNRYGETGTPRTWARLKPPSYAPDREAAVLSMTDEMQVKHITFFLQHETGRWRVVYTHFER